MRAATQERIRVRYGETDMMGHAYYANYLFWFEQARGAWCRARGFTYLQLEAMGYRLPVVEVWARYKGEVRYDDWVTVHVALGERKRSALQFLYEIVNESSGNLVTEGHTWHVLVSSAMKAVAIPAQVSELLDRNPDDWDRLV